MHSTTLVLATSYQRLDHHGPLGGVASSPNRVAALSAMSLAIARELVAPLCHRGQSVPKTWMVRTLRIPHFSCV
jgi:hypothetical protein